MKRPCILKTGAVVRCVTPPGWRKNVQISCISLLRYLTVMIVVVVVVVVDFCKTSIARLLNRHAESSDVVCYCSEQSVSEL